MFQYPLFGFAHCNRYPGAVRHDAAVFQYPLFGFAHCNHGVSISSIRICSLQRRCDPRLQMPVLRFNILYSDLLTATCLSGTDVWGNGCFNILYSDLLTATKVFRRINFQHCLFQYPLFGFAHCNGVLWRPVWKLFDVSISSIRICSLQRPATSKDKQILPRSFNILYSDLLTATSENAWRSRLRKHVSISSIRICSLQRLFRRLKHLVFWKVSISSIRICSLQLDGCAVYLRRHAVSISSIRICSLQLKIDRNELAGYTRFQYPLFGFAHCNQRCDQGPT